MKVKICGISDSNTLSYITNHSYPPEYIGFIVNYKKSKRFVEFSKLKKLLKIDKKKIKICSSFSKANR
jgi:phosphoribosylanthranilate isomerase